SRCSASSRSCSASSRLRRNSASSRWRSALDRRLSANVLSDAGLIARTFVETVLPARIIPRDWYEALQGPRQVQLQPFVRSSFGSLVLARGNLPSGSGLSVLPVVEQQQAEALPDV